MARLSGLMHCYRPLAPFPYAHRKAPRETSNGRQKLPVAGDDLAVERYELAGRIFSFFTLSKRKGLGTAPFSSRTPTFVSFRDWLIAEPG
jgi:hypothetical protein